MSDLHCPARMVLVAAGDARVGVSTSERVAHVYTAPAADTAAQLADALGVAVSVVPALRDATAIGAALADLSDLHRGETLVVVADADVLGALLGRRPEPGGTVTIEHIGTSWWEIAHVD